jgi:glycosyltransferase involved in cell wall biosynthesis
VHHLRASLAERGVDAVDASPRVDVAGLNRKSVYVTQGLAAYRRVLAALRDSRVDVVHYHVSIPGMSAWAALARARAGRAGGAKPMLLHLWNPWYDARDAHAGAAARREALYHRLFNAPATTLPFLSAFDVLVVSSEYQRRQLESHGVRGEIQVIPNGVDVDGYPPAPTEATRFNARRELGLPVERTLLLYYGHLTPWKGVRVLVEALPRALSENPHADLVVARTSYGGDEAAIRARLRDLGLARRVHFLGLCDVPLLLQAVDAGVVPTTAAVGTACHPNVVLEYQSAGVPLVASSVGSIPEAVEEGRTGLLARPGDALDLGEKIGTLLADAATRRRFAHAARERAQARFDWRAIAQRYERAYEDALASRPSRARRSAGSHGLLRARTARLF